MVFVTKHECKSRRVSNKAPEASAHKSNTICMRQPAYIINYIIKIDCLLEQFRSERPKLTSVLHGFGERSGSASPPGASGRNPWAESTLQALRPHVVALGAAGSSLQERRASPQRSPVRPSAGSARRAAAGEAAQASSSGQRSLQAHPFPGSWLCGAQGCACECWCVCHPPLSLALLGPVALLSWIPHSPVRPPGGVGSAHPRAQQSGAHRAWVSGLPNPPTTPSFAGPSPLSSTPKPFS